MKNQRLYLSLFRSIAGRTVTRVPGIDESTRALAQRLGHWPDRTNRFKGW